MQHAQSWFADSSRRAAFCGAGLAGCLLLVLLGLFGARQAKAEVTHVHAAELSPAGLNNPTSLAIDESTGAVVVLDGDRLYKFTSAGLASNFSAPEKNFLTLNCSQPCRNVAIDNSGGPNQGVIYIASQESSSPAGDRQVRVYLPSGEKADSIRNYSTGERSHSYCGVATDQRGQVYVGHIAALESNQVPGNKVNGTDYIDKLKPGPWVPEANGQKLSWPIQTTMLGLSPESNFGWCRVAANSEEDLYYSFTESSEGTATAPIKRSPHSAYGALPGPSVEVIDGAATAFAVDHATDDLYSDRKGEIARFDAQNQLRERFGSTHLENQSYGLAVNEGTGTVYATNVSTDSISVFGPVVTPDVTYGVATASKTSATVSGAVGPAGAGSVTDCVIEFGTTVSYAETPVKCSPDASGSPYVATTDVSAQLNGLAKETVYHYRISATNGNGTTRGVDQTFTTHNVAGVQTGAATEVGQSAATLTGSLIGDGDPTQVKFEWGSTSAYGSETASQPLGGLTGSKEVSAHVEGLDVYTPTTGTYHYRLVATNGSGSTYGADRTFTTAPPDPPEIMGASASDVTETSAVVTASIDPGKGATGVAVQYGRTTAYGLVAEVPGSIGAGSDGVPISADLLGLAPGNTYHFRVVATNFAGASQSADQTFSTFRTEDARSPGPSPGAGSPAGRGIAPPPVECRGLTDKVRVARKQAASLERRAGKASKPRQAAALRKKARKRAHAARQLERKAAECRAGGK